MILSKVCAISRRWARCQSNSNNSSQSSGRYTTRTLGNRRMSKTFDVSVATGQARAHAEQIRAGLSDARVATSQEDAKLTRNRTFTWMTSRTRAVRAAGNYPFRKEPEVRVRFGSAYERKQRRQQRNVSVDVIDTTTANATGAAQIE